MKGEAWQIIAQELVFKLSKFVTGSVRAGIVDVGQRTGQTFVSFPRVFAWNGSTVWGTARTFV